MKLRCTLLVALFCTALVAGCQVERGQTDFPDQERVDASVGADAALPGDTGLGQGPGAGTMTGTWLLFHERSTCVLGQEQLTHASYLVEMEQDGSFVSETRRLCDVQLSELFGMPVHLPQVVLDNIDFVDLDRGMVSTLKEGGSYVSSTELGLWGLELDDPLADQVPSNADSPRVIDTDGDGHPAVSFLVGENCLRYQAQRQILTYHGSFTGPNQIDGRSTGVTDIAVYGGSEDLCTVAPPVDSNDPDSRFRMVRIDGKGGAVDADTDGDDTVSCEEAKVLSPRVLETREPDNSNCAP